MHIRLFAIMVFFLSAGLQASDGEEDPPEIVVHPNQQQHLVLEHQGGAPQGGGGPLHQGGADNDDSDMGQLNPAVGRPLAERLREEEANRSITGITLYYYLSAGCGIGSVVCGGVSTMLAGFAAGTIDEGPKQALIYSSMVFGGVATLLGTFSLKAAAAEKEKKKILKRLLPQNV